MPTLPTAQSFGPRPIPRLSRNVVPIRNDQVSRAEAQLQLGMADADGRAGGAVADAANTIALGMEKQALASARSDFLSAIRR